jgi:hypothetical protein
LSRKWRERNTSGAKSVFLRIVPTTFKAEKRLEGAYTDGSINLLSRT